MMIRMPRSAGELSLLQRSVLSTLCVPSSISPLRTTCKEILKGESIPDGVTGIHGVVSRLVKD